MILYRQREKKSSLEKVFLRIYTNFVFKKRNRRIVAATKNKLNTENTDTIIKKIKNFKKRGDFKGFFEKILKIKQNKIRCFSNLV